MLHHDLLESKHKEDISGDLSLRVWDDSDEVAATPQNI
jgi:hypothetical protein